MSQYVDVDASDAADAVTDAEPDPDRGPIPADADAVTPSSSTRSYTRRSVPSSPGTVIFLLLSEKTLTLLPSPRDTFDHLPLSPATEEQNNPTSRINSTFSGKA